MVIIFSRVFLQPHSLNEIKKRNTDRENERQTETRTDFVHYRETVSTFFYP